MKKLIMFLGVVFLLGISTLRAENKAFDWSNPALGYDIHWVTNDGLNMGPGYQLGYFRNDAFGLRASAIGPTMNPEDISKISLGLSIDIPKLLGDIFGFEWELGAINPTLGASIGIDFKKLSEEGTEKLIDTMFTSLYVNIITVKIPF